MAISQGRGNLAVALAPGRNLRGSTFCLAISGIIGGDVRFAACRNGWLWPQLPPSRQLPVVARPDYRSPAPPTGDAFRRSSDNNAPGGLLRCLSRVKKAVSVRVVSTSTLFHRRTLAIAFTGFTFQPVHEDALEENCHDTRRSLPDVRSL